jgi:hypothetical protein
MRAEDGSFWSFPNVPIAGTELLIAFRAMAGPAYLSHSSIYFNLLTGTTGAPVSLQGFGMGTEISACYQSTNSFGIGISCTANYLPRQFTSAIFATLEYRFGS